MAARLVGSRSYPALAADSVLELLSVQLSGTSSGALTAGDDLGQHDLQ